MVSQAYKLRKYACGGVWFLFSFGYNKTLTSQAFLGVNQIFCDVLLLVKSGATRNKLQQARRGCNLPKTTSNKEKLPSLCATNDTDRHLMILSSLSGQRNGLQLKKQFFKINRYCQENSMLKYLHDRYLEFSELLDIID